MQVTQRRAAAPTFQAFRFPAFARFWLSALVALSGFSINFTIQGYLVYELSRDPFVLGALSFSLSLPLLLLGPFSGLLIDRVDRRNLLIALQFAQACVLLGLFTAQITRILSVGVIILAAFIVGAVSALDWPCRLTYVPSLVDRPALPSAVALSAAIFPLGTVLGPAIAGFLLRYAGAEWGFLIAALGYLTFGLLLRGLPESGTRAAGVANPMADLIAGYRYIAHHGAVFGLLVVMVMPVIFGRLYQMFMPAVAKDVLGVDQAGFGTLLSSAGLGAFIGMLGVPWLAGLRLRGRVLVFAVGVIGLTELAFALSVLYPLSLFLVLLVGLIQSAFYGLTTSLLQIATEEQYRGRVMSLNTLIYGISPLGYLLAGWVAGLLGVPATIALGGMLISVVALAGPRLFQAVWSFD